MLRAGPPPCLPTAYGLLPIRRRVLVLVALVALCLVVASDLRAAEGGFVVVAHAATVPAELERAFVADAFLKKRTRWPGGEAIRPVDQRRDAPARRHFSEVVLKRSVDAVRSYWQQRIFSGRDVPPPEAESDLSVLRYVQENAGAIGYVSDAPNVHGVRVVTLK